MSDNATCRQEARGIVMGGYRRQQFRAKPIHKPRTQPMPKTSQDCCELSGGASKHDCGRPEESPAPPQDRVDCQHGAAILTAKTSRTLLCCERSRIGQRQAAPHWPRE